jgi:hypothetical protein
MRRSANPLLGADLTTLAGVVALAIPMVAGLAAHGGPVDELAVINACAEAAKLRLIATERSRRFLGKVDEAQARCLGGDAAVAQMTAPWVDWSNYWATGDRSSRSDQEDSGVPLLDRNKRGINGALLNLEYQRMELIKFNLFDNNDTFEQYLSGVHGDGAIVRTWKEMRLAPNHPNYGELRIAADGSQTCRGDAIRHRTLTGICNDIRNPAMGSTGQLFARNVEFEAAFPDLGLDPYARNRHGGRIGLLQPDPQVISRKLFTRQQEPGSACNEGRGHAGSVEADCSYRKAASFNVLAAFWIQFMTHDWFSHLDEGRNDQSRVMTSLGCASERVDNVERPLSVETAQQLGCRTGDHMDAALIAQHDAPGTFRYDGVDRLRRAPKTTRNNVTAWWDASQIYGYDERSLRRVRRDPADPAKLDMEQMASGGGSDRRYGYLPVFRPACAPGAADACDPIQPEWSGQEAVAFPDNWSIGSSFYHNLFAREHNLIVDEFRKRQEREPQADSGLRNPDNPSRVITYGQITDNELFDIARLIVAAEIAKIHTIEWTTQLLYDEPLYVGMNSNWSGLFDDQQPLASQVTREIVRALTQVGREKEANQLYSAFAAGAGIVGTGATKRRPALLPNWLSWLEWDAWSLSNEDDIDGGVNHFGSPFNFPEEFVSVYRLHPMVPDLLEFRALDGDPNAIRQKIAVIDTFRGKATSSIRQGGLANWALTMGRQRLGALALRNHPQFLQNLDLNPRMDSKIDVAALDLIRDRERGIPRFNEFRRQIGLRQLTSFDDFIDRRPAVDESERAQQRELVGFMRDVYGQHPCDVSKVITTSQRDEHNQPINDCLGHPDGSMVDNIEDVDLVVGFLAETTRPHGFAISETQFQIFILNASRRLFSDRFFTSSFRPEFYTKLGIDWVMNNGPDGKQWEAGEPNGHKQEISPLKRVLLRAMPELAPELDHVVNAFDPWARDRGEYYSLQWKPRAGAAADPAFKQ